VASRSPETGSSRTFRLVITFLIAAVCCCVATAFYVSARHSSKQVTSPYRPSEAEASAAVSPIVGTRSPLVPAFRVGAPGNSEKTPAADIPPPPPMNTAEQSAAEVLSELQRSGSTAGAWTSKIEGAFRTWRESPGPGGKVDVTDFRCFKKGCTVTSVHPDMQSLEKASSDFLRSPEYMEVNLPGFRSGPIQLPSGNFKVIWVLYHNETDPT